MYYAGACFVVRVADLAISCNASGHTPDLADNIHSRNRIISSGYVRVVYSAMIQTSTVRNALTECLISLVSADASKVFNPRHMIYPLQHPKAKSLLERSESYQMPREVSCRIQIPPILKGCC